MVEDKLVVEEVVEVIHMVKGQVDRMEIGVASIVEEVVRIEEQVVHIEPVVVLMNTMKLILSLTKIHLLISYGMLKRLIQDLHCCRRHHHRRDLQRMLEI